MKITDLENKKLNDWKLTTLYSCARLHNTAGYFPLIEKGEQKIIMTPSRGILEIIWTSIAPMFVHVQSGLWLVNHEKNIILSLNQDQPDINSNMFCLVPGVMHSTFINGAFGYAPGLIITRDESEAKFPVEKEMSLIRNNLMTEKGYSPYCGDDNCIKGMPRTIFNGSQFICSCGWVSVFPDDFIRRYKEKWGIGG